MGMRKGMEALLTGDHARAKAVSSGMANRAFPKENLDTGVLNIAEQLQKYQMIYWFNKEAAHRAMESTGIRNGSEQPQTFKH